MRTHATVSVLPLIACQAWLGIALGWEARVSTEFTSFANGIAPEWPYQIKALGWAPVVITAIVMAPFN